MSEEAKQETTTATTFKCGQCGAKMEFKPGALAQVCPYCDHENPIPQSEEDITELDFVTYLKQQSEQEDSQEQLVVNCSIREMPRFIGQFQTQAQDGSSLNHTIRLVMALPNFLVGSWRFTAQTSNGPISGLRYVIFDRKAPNIGN